MRRRQPSRGDECVAIAQPHVLPVQSLESKRRMHVRRAREVEEIADQQPEQPEEEEARMEVDGEEPTAELEKEEKSPSSAGTQSRPASAEQDTEMESTSPDASQPNEAKRKSSEALSEPPRERKRLREESEPADEEEPGEESQLFAELHGFTPSQVPVRRKVVEEHKSATKNSRMSLACCTAPSHSTATVISSTILSRSPKPRIILI